MSLINQFLTMFLNASLHHDPSLTLFLMGMFFLVGLLWGLYIASFFLERPITQLVVNQALVMANGQAQFYQQKVNF